MAAAAEGAPDPEQAEGVASAASGLGPNSRNHRHVARRTACCSCLDHPAVAEMRTRAQSPDMATRTACPIRSGTGPDHRRRCDRSDRGRDPRNGAPGRDKRPTAPRRSADAAHHPRSGRPRLPAARYTNPPGLAKVAAISAHRRVSGTQHVTRPAPSPSPGRSTGTWRGRPLEHPNVSGPGDLRGNLAKQHVTRS
jgi:hypothetical protein